MVLVVMSMYTYTVFMSRNDASGNEKIDPGKEKKSALSVLFYKKELSYPLVKYNHPSSEIARVICQL